MKKLILLLFAVLNIGLSPAQNNGFNYKALITENGNALINHPVTLKFNILYDGTTSVYEESQTVTTDANGIVSVIVGEGTPISGDFYTIDWSASNFYLNVQIDTGNGFTDFGTTAFKFVPYAKYAEKAGNTFSGDFNDLNNVPAGLADGDDVNDADHDATNELQTLSINGNQLSISNGNTVTLPAGSSGDQWGSQVVQSDNSLSGDGTTTNPLAINTNSSAFDGWDKNASDDFSGSFTDLTNVPAGLSDGDDDTHLSDSDIAAMGYIKNPNDADHDAANELQNLSLTGTNLAISNGNSVNFNGWDTNAADDFSGNFNDLTNKPVSFYKAGTTNQPTQINDDIYTHGKVGIGIENPTASLSIFSTNENSISIIDYDATHADHIGMFYRISGSASGNISGVKMLSNNTGSNGNIIGSEIYLQGNNDATKRGIYVSIPNGSGTSYGSMILISSSGIGTHFGSFSLLSGTGNGDKYGTYNEIDDNAGGKHYAVYGKATKNATDVYAGYFLGKVAVGTTDSDKYIMPVSKGTAGQIMQIDGNGQVNWVDYISSADNWGTQSVVSDASLSGNGTTAQPLAVDTNSAAFNGWDKNAADDFSGNYNDLTNKPVMFYKTGTNHDLPTNINDDMYSLGTLSIGENNSDGRLNVNPEGIENGINVSGNLSGGSRYASIFNHLSGDTDADVTSFSIENEILGQGEHKALNVKLMGGGNAVKRGINIEIENATNIATAYQSKIITLPGNPHAISGLINEIESNGGGDVYGTSNVINGQGDAGAGYYGSYNTIDPTTAGNHYAVYASATGTPAPGNEFYAGYFEGDVKISQKLKSTISGDADMKAYVYGYIDHNGFKVTGKSSTGYTSNYDSNEMCYIITLEDANLENYVVVANPQVVDPALITVKQYQGYFRVYVYNLNGTLSQSDFSFVVYKK